MPTSSFLLFFRAAWLGKRSKFKRVDVRVITGIVPENTSPRDDQVYAMMPRKMNDLATSRLQSTKPLEVGVKNVAPLRPKHGHGKSTVPPDC